MVRKQRHRRADHLLSLAMFLLVGLGLIVIYSISPVLSHKLAGDVGENHFLFGQLFHVGVALAAFLVASRIHYGRWEKLLPALIVVSAFSLMLLLIPDLSISKNGATRWVGIGPLSFQPAELLKFTILIFLASRFSATVQRGDVESRRKLKLAGGAIALVAVFVLFLQRDMGTMVVISAMILAMYFASGAALKHVAGLGLLGVGVGVGSIILFPHRIARVLTYLDPAADPSSTGYHLNQALIAIGSGGLLGLGIGKSVQVYGYLPEAANDSIFAIIGETMGFLGALLVLGLFAFLIYRGAKIAMGAPDRFSQLIAVGVITWIGTQAVVNITAMLGLIPLTGIPLPFLSYGGTSLVMAALGLGVVVNISKYSSRGSYAQSSAIRGRNRRTSNAYSQLRPSSKPTE